MRNHVKVGLRPERETILVDSLAPDLEFWVPGGGVVVRLSDAVIQGKEPVWVETVVGGG